MSAVAGSAVLLIGAAPVDAPRLPFSRSLPRHLLPVADKPWLQHVVEALRSAGVTRLYCLDALAPDSTRALLGDGTRWGCLISHHPVADAACPCGALGRIPLGPGLVWVVDAADWAVPDPACPPAPMRLVAASGEAVGWALLDAATRRRIPPTLPACGLAAWLTQEVPAASTCGTVQRLRDGDSLLRAQREVLEQRHPATLDAMQVEPGVWIARNVRLHPTAVVRAPVLLGADSWLQADSCVGPNAVIGAGAIVGAQCSVADAWLGRATALGDGLELRRSCAWKSRAWNFDLAEELDISDPHLLAALHSGGLRPVLSSLWARAAAAAALAAAAPALLAAAMWQRWRHGRWFTVLRVARLPAPGFPERRAELALAVWEPAPQRLSGLRHLLHWLLPGLWHVVCGRLRWIGIAPRSWDAIDAVPEDVRNVLVDARCGLIDEAWVRYGPAGLADADAELRLWTDVFQAVQHEHGYARRLLLDYLRCVVLGRHAVAAARDDNLSSDIR